MFENVTYEIENNSVLKMILPENFDLEKGVNFTFELKINNYHRTLKVQTSAKAYCCIKAATLYLSHKEGLDNMWRAFSYQNGNDILSLFFNDIKYNQLIFIEKLILGLRWILSEYYTNHLFEKEISFINVKIENVHEYYTNIDKVAPILKDVQWRSTLLNCFDTFIKFE